MVLEFDSRENVEGVRLNMLRDYRDVKKPGRENFFRTPDQSDVVI